MKWTPEAFANATFRDISDAIAGHNMLHGGSKTDAPTRDELEDLKRRYPDGH